jgi:hypothetical protein
MAWTLPLPFAARQTLGMTSFKTCGHEELRETMRKQTEFMTIFLDTLD